MENSYKPVFSPEDYINIHTYTAMGMSYEDFELPVVGICNTWSELVPGQYNLRQSTSGSGALPGALSASTRRRRASGHSNSGRFRRAMSL